MYFYRSKCKNDILKKETLKSILHYFSCFIVISITMLACNSDVASSLEARKMALGKMNDILVIADDEMWDGDIGDTIRYYLESPYPIMPTPESTFNLRHFNAAEIENQPLRRGLRTYAIVADLSDMESPVTKMVREDLGEEKFTKAKSENKLGTSIGKNKWANGQLLVYLFANGKEDLSKTIRQSFPAISKRINEHDKKMLESQVFATNFNKGLSEDILYNYGIDLKLPQDYQIAEEIKEENFIWLRKDTDIAILNLAISKMPYTGEEQFSKEALLSRIETFGKTKVTSATEGSYMRTNDKDFPVFEYTETINGMYTKEIRGVWEMTSDFMGGPFVAYLMHNKGTNELISAYAFVYAPGKAKRDFIQQLDFLVNSIKPSAVASGSSE